MSLMNTPDVDRINKFDQKWSIRVLELSVTLVGMCIEG